MRLIAYPDHKTTLNHFQNEKIAIVINISNLHQLDLHNFESKIYALFLHKMYIISFLRDIC